MVLRIFKIALRFRDRHFYVTITGGSNINTLTLKQVFRKTKTILKELEYLFIVESTMIESATFPYKIALSKANIKINRMKAQNGSITKKFCHNSFEN